jgi:hypothetical protein
MGFFFYESIALPPLDAPLCDENAPGIQLPGSAHHQFLVRYQSAKLNCFIGTFLEYDCPRGCGDIDPARSRVMIAAAACAATFYDRFELREQGTTEAKSTHIEGMGR